MMDQMIYNGVPNLTKEKKNYESQYPFNRASGQNCSRVITCLAGVCRTSESLVSTRLNTNRNGRYRLVSSLRHVGN